MLILHGAEKKYPLVQFSTDDFGNEVIAVATYNKRLDYMQVVVGMDTWLHLFDLSQSIRAEADHD
jgi:hypothetical protein